MSSSAGRPDTAAVELVDEDVVVGPYRLIVRRPRDAEELLDEGAFEQEEFLPYWAELWPSALALAEVVAGLDLRGARVVELGCGLAVPSIVAVLAGADVLATDWSEDALRFARENARRNGVELTAAVVRWSSPHELFERAPYDLTIASDVLYERRNVEELATLLPALAPVALLAEPGRPHARALLDAFRHEEIAARVYRLATASVS